MWRRDVKSPDATTVRPLGTCRPTVTSTPFVGCVSNPITMHLTSHVEPNVASSPSYADVSCQNRPASTAAPPPAKQQQRKRKADHEQSRSVTPRKEAKSDVKRVPSRDREEHRRRDREDRHQDHENQEERHHREERREDRCRKRDRKREWRCEGHLSWERSSHDRGGNHNRRRSPDHRPHRDHSPLLYSSESQEPSLAEVPSVAEHRIPNLTSDTEIELPLPLWHLISSGGIKLAAVPDNTWNIHGYAGKLHRTLSVWTPLSLVKKCWRPFAIYVLMLRISFRSNIAVPTALGALFLK